jgi:hypothetical protein
MAASAAILFSRFRNMVLMIQALQLLRDDPLGFGLGAFVAQPDGAAVFGVVGTSERTWPERLVNVSGYKARWSL